MEWLTIAFRFLPMMIELAEKMFGDGTGPQKKNYVMNEAVPAIAKGIEAVSTGGQKDTWKKINDNMDTLSKTVDVVVDIMYPKFTEVGDR